MDRGSVMEIGTVLRSLYVPSIKGATVPNELLAFNAKDVNVTVWRDMVCKGPGEIVINRKVHGILRIEPGDDMSVLLQPMTIDGFDTVRKFAERHLVEYV